MSFYWFLCVFLVVLYVFRFKQKSQRTRARKSGVPDSQKSSFEGYSGPDTAHVKRGLKLTFEKETGGWHGLCQQVWHLECLNWEIGSQHGRMCCLTRPVLAWTLHLLIFLDFYILLLRKVFWVFATAVKWSVTIYSTFWRRWGDFCDEKRTLRLKLVLSRDSKNEDSSRAIVIEDQRNPIIL